MPTMKHYWYMILVDALLTFVSIIFSMMLRLEVVYPDRLLFSYYLRIIWPFIVFAMVLRPIVFYFSGIYKRIWRYAYTKDFIALAVSVLIGTVILSILSLLIIKPFWIRASFPRSLLILEAIISLFLLGGFRVILKMSERYPGDIDWKATGITPNKRVLIAGAGNTGVNISRELLTNPQLGLQPVAFIDDDPKKIGMKIQDLTVSGPLIRLVEVVKEKGIDEVIVAMPSAPAQILDNIKSLCQGVHIPFSMVSSFSSLIEQSDVLPASALKVPMAMPDITSEEIQAVLRVMQSRNLSIGSQTVTFEKLAAGEANAAHAVAVINGTSALHLCMVAANIQPDDEVITSPFSFISSSNCILFERAKPVFVDIDPVTLNMDAGRIESAITERTRAIIVVHVFGQPADMDPIMEIAAKYNLIVIEDSCEAIGAEYKGRRVGAIGKAGTYAFYPNKQMTSGEGAVLVTNDEEWANLFRSLRNQGRDKFDGWLNHSRLGFNYRMSELNAAVGVVQIRRLDGLLRKRDNVANEYNRILSNIENVSPLTIAPTTTRMSWFVYVVRLAPGISRDKTIVLLGEKGIPARPYFSPIHLQPFYRKQFGFKQGDFPETEAAGESIIALPFYANMKTEEIELVCNVLADSIK
ncbi:MAG: UDP-4-amino-4-deoxy-L-arabinose--oxoglutarate aminotransferase [Syntrophorhabdaceae bacterium]|nr:UDP-4-amino-4-deoxy-L-arabinose--oxoglutarate aminotransferase [Syntrophorhabdaceae bacterium]HOS06414.1 DegT/DnrJ/EryC1/StrS family aminotransferase [Syntrophorhabdaceae bacterium]HQG51614.1 DegT/DnrJ/EryC1/StrS family aminotransferase [Syntrophorhabdaceae bacterium]